MRFHKFLIVFFFLCSHILSVQARDPVLMYNQFPRIWDMNFDAMKEYLFNIRALGFNIVWVNPFFKTSDNVVVNRVNEWNGEHVKAKKSLYAMYDPSLIYDVKAV